jgi:hypothetical protein
MRDPRQSKHQLHCIDESPLSHSATLSTWLHFVCPAAAVCRKVALAATSRKQSVMDDAISSFAWIAAATATHTHRTRTAALQGESSSIRANPPQEMPLPFCSPQFCILRALCAAELPSLRLFVRKRAM